MATLAQLRRDAFVEFAVRKIDMKIPVQKSKYRTTFESPVGTLLAIATEDALCVLHMVGAKHAPKADMNSLEDTPKHPIFVKLRQELAEYFRGERKQFEVKVAPDGTPFQRAVWKALTKVPYGSTCTYGEQAAALKNPGAVRAVGAANGRNPIGIVIPCHRVVGAGGKLTGYAGGVGKKAQLLALEAGVAHSGPLFAGI
jgi:methylated-DNA-[protein]-cysteine S-methyltransferase